MLWSSFWSYLRNWEQPRMGPVFYRPPRTCLRCGSAEARRLTACVCTALSWEPKQAPTCHTWHFSSSSPPRNYLLDRILGAGTVASCLLLSAAACWVRTSPLHSTCGRPPGHRHPGSFSWKKFFFQFSWHIWAGEAKPLARKESDMFEYGKA